MREDTPSVVPAECMWYITPDFWSRRCTAATSFETEAVGVPMGMRQKSKRNELDDLDQVERRHRLTSGTRRGSGELCRIVFGHFGRDWNEVDRWLGIIVSTHIFVGECGRSWCGEVELHD